MLEFQNVTVSLGKNTILNDISFSVPERKLTVLLGKNGAGKTTLANCLFGQQNYSGNILLNNKDIRKESTDELAKHLSLLPQLLPCPNITVRELVAFGRSPYMGIQHRLTKQDICAVEEAIVLADCVTIRDRYLPSLSGGERQKAFLAMTLAQQTNLIVLDEPTTYMDAVAESDFLNLLQALTRQGKTVILILHNLSLAVKYADQIVILDNGRCGFSGTKDECLNRQEIENTFHVLRFDAVCNGEREIFFSADTK